MIKLGLKIYLKGILPLENEIQTLNSHLTKINNVLNTNSKLLSIKSVRNGGSFAKRTMLKRRLEADPFYFHFKCLKKSLIHFYFGKIGSKIYLFIGY